MDFSGISSSSGNFFAQLMIRTVSGQCEPRVREYGNAKPPLAKTGGGAPPKLREKGKELMLK
jgi:hypothetical protein